MSNENKSFNEMEHRVLEFWEENKCFEKLKAKNEGNERYRFLDGPITANNPMGIHHAWGRSLKDIYIRYKAMQGFDCRYQNGFDSQGLWVEVGTEQDLGFKTKHDIEEYGLDKFTLKCKERVNKFADIITEQSKRLGQWMDWDNSYFTNTDENIGGIWHFLKACHENGWIDSEYRPMPWCPRCGTSLSEHEMTGSYKMITHDSVFFKLPIKGMNSKMLVWTTTPWTLSSNVALAVNPELEYFEVKVKSDTDTIFLAKNAIKYLGDDKEEVLRAVKGSELIGKEFETCFPDFEAQQGVAHNIVAWDDVSAEEGTGVVHIAPGCGIEDFELGNELGLVKLMPIDDLGVFLPGFGFLSGKESNEVAEEIFAELERQNKLYKIIPYEHSYPVCWRCKHEVVYRLVPAWYIRTAELKPRLMRASATVKWEPESNGKRMHDWLENMGDWNISRKRYYGMPLPFYDCDCGHLTVIGSKKELREKAVDPTKVDALPELHRPWIDEVEIVCPACGKPVKRIPEIGDVWLDAGIVPFSTTGYFTDKEEWKKNYPAEWITEMREQVRLWFYSMLFMSVVLEDKAPYERALCYNAVVQEDGSKFSKTGFMIQFDEAAEKIGADSIRYLYAGAPIANDVRFGYTLGDEARRKLLNFKNIPTFFDTYASVDKPVLDGYVPEVSKMSPTDKWLILRTNEFIDKAEGHFEDYKAYNLIRDFEVYVDDISNWYIRTNRRRFWKMGDESDKTLAYWVLLFAIESACRCMAPIIPFMTEDIWQEVVRPLKPDSALSVHLSGWPQKFDGVVEDGITEQTALARDIIATTLRLRNENQIKVRQPLQKLFICCNDEVADKVKVFEQTILDELNIREIEYTEDKASLEVGYLQVDFKVAGRVLKQNANKMKQCLADLPSEDMAKAVAEYDQGGMIHIAGWDEEFDSSLFIRKSETKPDIIAADFNNGANVLALDIKLTDDLIADGAVRDLVRSCQVLRKDAGYVVEQEIALMINTDDDFILNAINDKRDHIASELLAQEVVINDSFIADMTNDVEIMDKIVTIGVRKWK